jgi:alkanesulfonate monooxygenase SsuD/methylene tetrahydromethanopterin reductase-like flavin-dependent oxidoreductase (luciferase family)
MFGIPFPPLKERVDRLECDEYAAKRRLLEAHCAAAGRDPRALTRSLMVPVIVGRTASDIAARHARARAIFPRVPEDETGWRAAGFLYGTPERVVADLKRWESLGVQRVMLQMLDMEDDAAMDVLAREVVPAVQ